MINSFPWGLLYFSLGLIMFFLGLHRTFSGNCPLSLLVLGNLYGENSSQIRNLYAKAARKLAENCQNLGFR